MAGTGRNTKTEGKKQKKLTLYLSPEVEEQIDKLAENEGRSFASQVAILLERELHRPKFDSELEKALDSSLSGKNFSIHREIVNDLWNVMEKYGILDNLTNGD